MAAGSPKRNVAEVPVFERTRPFSCLPSLVLEELKPDPVHNVASSEVGRAARWGPEVGTLLGKIKTASWILICKCYRYYPSCAPRRKC